ncbi:MAG: hypothetical protein ACTSUE_10475 [Promethearchaeota archaeon]
MKQRPRKFAKKKRREKKEEEEEEWYTDDDDCRSMEWKKTYKTRAHRRAKKTFIEENPSLERAIPSAEQQASRTMYIPPSIVEKVTGNEVSQCCIQGCYNQPDNNLLYTGKEDLPPKFGHLILHEQNGMKLRICSNHYKRKRITRTDEPRSTTYSDYGLLCLLIASELPP